MKINGCANKESALTEKFVAKRIDQDFFKKTKQKNPRHDMGYNGPIEGMIMNRDDL